MKNKAKNIAKKYIAGILTVTLVGGVIHYADVLESHAQIKATLPGIESIVSKYSASNDTYNILEIVADNSDVSPTSIGWLIGGQEPVKYGDNKVQSFETGLAKLPAKSEREQFAAAATPNTDLGVSDRGNYEEITTDASTEASTEDVYEVEIRGKLSPNDSGKYRCLKTTPTYRIFESGDEGKPRYNHVVKFASASEPVESTSDKKWYNLDFKKNTGVTDLEITESTADGENKVKDVTDTKYTLSKGNPLASADLSKLESLTAYEKKSLYKEIEADNSYSYYGYVVKGKPDGAATDDVSSGDVSTGDLINESESFYIIKGDGTVIPWVYQFTNSANSTAEYRKADGFTDSENGIFVADFSVATDGEYCATKASSVLGKKGFYEMTESSYVGSENGAYVMEGSDNIKVVIETDTDWATAPEQRYDFIPGDTTCTEGEIEIDYTVRYKSKFKNAEWFKTNVLDLSLEECKNVNIKVTTLSFSELCELVADSSKSDTYGVDLNLVNFVYLAGDYSNVNVTDAKKAEDAVLKLAQMALGDDRIPFAIDQSCYKSTNGNTNVAALSNFLLSQAKNGDKSITAENIKKATFSESVTNGYLAANVYLSEGTFVNSDFLTEKAGEPYTSLYSDVYNTAKKENDLREWNGLGRDINEEITDATIARYIINWNARRDTVKEAIHVLDVEPTGSYDSDSIIQAKVSSFINDEQYDETKINVIHMASAEFIGKVEELNELYDMIYFGDNIGQLNVNGDTPVYNDSNMNGLVYTHTGDVYSYDKEDEEEQRRLPNDSLKDYRDYTYRGPGNDINSTRMEELKAYVKAGYVVVFADRYFKNADNDKVEVNTTAVDSNSHYHEFMDFVLEKDSSGNFLYWNKNVFTENNLYDASLAGNNSSDAKKAAQQARQESFRRYISLSKLSINWEEVDGQESKPVEYSYNGTEGSAKMLDDNELIYTFSLHSDSAVATEAVTYDCKLFIDANSDGRFAGSDLAETKSTEEIDNLSIYVYENGAWNSVDRSDGRYQLSINKTYRVEREIPDGYVGVLPWKIVFYNNNNTGIRTSESGYTAIKRKDEKIKILQLISDEKNNKDRNSWNLAKDPEVGTLLGEVKDIVGFEITIKTMKVSQISDAARAQAKSGSKYMSSCRQYAANEFSKYNMIIVGFADNYQFGTVSKDANKTAANLAVAEALKDYIDAGNSVLFAHDTTTYIESTLGLEGDYSWYWGYEFNKALRATVGLDRFGTSLEYYSDKVKSAEDKNYETDREYYQNTLDKLNTYDFDVIKEPNSTESNSTEDRKEGLTRYTAVRFMYRHLEKLIEKKGGSVKLSGEATFYFPVRNKLFYNAIYTNDGEKALFGTYGGKTQEVTKVNSGQITTYPFTLDDTMTVANTHYQWLQPNMELDRDDDGKNDIVVWYCLSDVNGYGNNIYNLVKNDVVNNYYIYSMGNVTYSGVGHSTPKSLAESDEKRLFINTMVAAYKQGIRVPGLNFTDEAGNDTSSVYVMFDSQNGMALDLGSGANNFSVNFHATDNNIVSGKDVRVEFFRDAKSTEETNAIVVSGTEEDGKVVPIANNATVRKASDKNAVTPVNVSKDETGAINGRFAGSTYYSVQNGEKYIFSFSLEELGLFSKDENGKMTISDGIEDTTIYARVTTVYDNGNEITNSSIQELHISPAELFELR